MPARERNYYYKKSKESKSKSKFNAK